MKEYNLTDRQKQLLTIIIESIKEGKDIEPLMPSITFQDSQIIGIDHKFDRTLIGDLEALCEEDLLSATYNSGGDKTYTVKQSAHDVVANNFRGDTPKVFLSHIHEEAPLALVLNDWIEKAFPDQINVFVSSDEKDIPAGEKWLDKIDGALGESQAFIILCSPYSISRPWINFETGCAWVKKVPVIAICHSGQSISSLPRPLSDFQDLAIGDREFIDKLLSSLAHHLGLGKIHPIDKASMMAEISNSLEKSISALSKAAQSSIPENAQKAIPPLLAALSDDYSTVRVEAVKALGKIGGPGILQALSDATKDKSPGVRAAAIEAIEKIHANSNE